MPPKGSQKPAAKSAKPNASLTSAFKALSKKFLKAKNTTGDIKDEPFTNPIKEAMRSNRWKSTTIEPTFVTDLVTELDDGLNVCSRLDVTLFSLMVEVILQSDHCRHSERGLFLLAESLCRDRNQREGAQLAEYRRTAIGKLCLELILTFFLDTSNHPGIRRWAGILCLQLVNGSDENVNKLEHCPESLRRSIGEVVVEEGNEIIRTLCGRLIRVLQRAEVELEHLWPLDADETLYQKFPVLTQKESGWSQQFQAYVDEVYAALEEKPELTNKLYWASSCSLQPDQLFGSPNQKVNITVEPNTITILSPAIQAVSDQILDIPVSALKRMTTVLQTSSQKKGQAWALFHLKNGEGIACCDLDGKSIILDVVTLLCDMETINSIGHDLEDFNIAGLKFCTQYDEASTRKVEHNPQQQRGVRTFQSQESQGVFCNSEVEEGQQSQVSNDEAETLPLPKDNKEPRKQGHLNRTTSSPAQEARENDLTSTLAEETQIPVDSEGIYDASPLLKKANVSRTTELQDVTEDPGSDVEVPGKGFESPPGKQTQADTTREIARRNQKPKAKPPIKFSLHINRPAGNLATTNTNNAERKKKVTNEPERNADTEKTQPKSSKAYAPVKGKSVDRVNSEPLTDPDSHDTSTPKVTETGATTARSDHPAVNKNMKLGSQDNRTRSQKLQEDLTAAANAKGKKTRSSGYKAKAAAPQSDVYDLPDDDEDEEDFVSAKTKSKASKNIANRKANANPQRASQRASQPHVKKAAAKNTEEIKKRRSAPAVLEKMPAPRSKITRSVTSAESLGRVSAEAPKAQKVENAEKSAKAQKAQKAPKAPKDETVTEAVKGTPTILKKASAKSKSEMELDQAPQEEDPMVTRVNGDQAGVDPMDLDDIGMSEKPQREQKDITLEKPPESEGKKGKEVLTKNASLDMASKLESMLDFSGADDDVASENAVDEMAIEHGSPQEEHSSRNQIDELADARHEDTLVHSKSHQDPKEGQRTNVADSLTNDALLPKPVAEKIPVEEPIFKKVQIEELVTEKVEIEGHIIEIIQAETHVAKKVWIEEPAIKPQVEEAAASEKAQAEEPATEKVSIEEPVVERVQIEEPAAEKVEIEKRVAKSPERAIINVPEATQTNVEISEVDRTKHSSPAEPANSPKPYVEGSADSRKRKGSFQQSTPPKKRKAREIEVQVDPKPVRRSPRIAARTKATSTETCNDNAAETSLVDEHSIRKPTLIEFSRNGPKNQGSLLNRPPSVQRPPCSHQTHESKWEVVKRAMKSVQATSGDKKRKRDEVKLPVNSPPRKRQSSSPRLQIPAQYIEDAEENIAPVFASSPPEPAELSQPPPLPSIPRLRLPRGSSQGSRVNANGSPFASPSVKKFDYISKAQGKLEKDADQAQQDQQLPRRRESSEVFGPRVRLGSQLKARPMSPDKSEPRYIPHQKTKHGQYEELSTKEVIQPQKVLPDPFVEKARKSSDFTERLRTSATCGNKIARPSPCVAKTSVAREVLEHVEESLPDLSSGSGSSAVSRSIEQSRTPLKELEMADTWNMAIRPHYASMRDVVHRIADEMIIKLSNEEDKMELLIDQYKENGTKVLDKLTQKRVEEKSTMRRILQQKKKNMISAYTEAKKSISKTAEKLKEAPIALFEKEWRSRQNSIRDRISKARKGVE